MPITVSAGDQACVSRAMSRAEVGLRAGGLPVNLPVRKGTVFDPLSLPGTQGGLPARVLPDPDGPSGRAVPVPDGHARGAWGRALC